MSNGVKIGLLGVIAALLGVLAFKIIDSKNEKSMSRDLQQPGENTSASGAEPGTFYPVTDGKYKTADGSTVNVPSTASVDAQGKPQPINGDTSKGWGGQSATRAKTQMTFEKTEHDFGTMKQGDRVEYAFKFTNTGREPLIIEDAKGSCGCTVPVWPKDPIPPGKSDEIRVSFNSAGKSGVQSKVVTLTANTEPLQTALTIKAKVDVPEGGETTPVKH